MKIKSFMSVAFAVALLMGTGTFADNQKEDMPKTEMAGDSSEGIDARRKNMELYDHFDKTQAEINDALAKGTSKEVKERVSKALEEHRSVVAGTLFNPIDFTDPEQLIKDLVAYLGQKVVDSECGTDLSTTEEKVACIEKLDSANSAISKVIGAACDAGCNRASCINRKLRGMCEAVCCTNHADKIQHCVAASPGSTETCDNYTTTNPYPAPGSDPKKK